MVCVSDPVPLRPLPANVKGWNKAHVLNLIHITRKTASQKFRLPYFLQYFFHKDVHFWNLCTRLLVVTSYKRNLVILSCFILGVFHIMPTDLISPFVSLTKSAWAILSGHILHVSVYTHLESTFKQRGRLTQSACHWQRSSFAISFAAGSTLWRLGPLSTPLYLLCNYFLTRSRFSRANAPTVFFSPRMIILCSPPSNKAAGPSPSENTRLTEFHFSLANLVSSLPFDGQLRPRLQLTLGPATLPSLFSPP